MATSYTPTLNLAKPLVNGPETENTWGFDLNANSDKIDAYMAAHGAEWAQDQVGQLLRAGPNVSIQYLDFSDKIVISATGDFTVLDPGEGAVFFETRTWALTATLPPFVKTFHTGGFDTPGDGGHGAYGRVGAAPADINQPGYVRTGDGSWWRLIPQGGQVFLEQFGGKADWNGTTGTDNWGALAYAKSFTAYSTNAGLIRYSYAILVNPGDYYFGQTISFFEVVQIRAQGGGMNVGGPSQVRWHFPNTITWMVFHQNNTGPGEDQGGGGLGSSTGSIIQGITLRGVGDPAYENLNRRGILMRTQAHLRDVQVHACAGVAIFIRAYAGAGGALEGNANCWRLENCVVHGPKGDFLRVLGADVNAGLALNFITHGISGQGGCGIRNESYYVNNYVAPQITGYGNTGVHRAGKRYVLVNPAGGEATEPGTNNTVWYFFVEGPVHPQVYPEWTPTPVKPYVLQNPIWDSGGGAVYEAVYVELGGGHPSHISQPSMMLGGNAATTRTSGAVTMAAVGGLQSKAGYAIVHNFEAGSAEAAAQGATTLTAYGSVSEENGWGADGGLQIFSHRRYKEGEFSAQFGYHQDDLVYRYLNSPVYWTCTTTNTRKTYGGFAPKPYRLALGDISVGGNDGRVISMIDGPPNFPGEHVRGDRYFNKNATGDSIQSWLCTQTGIAGAGVWVNGQGYGGNEYVTTSGRFYKNKSFGISTSEPTHTSGAVTYPDGLTWTYVGNSTPIYVSVYESTSPILLTAMQDTIQSLTARLAALEARDGRTDS